MYDNYYLNFILTSKVIKMSGSYSRINLKHKLSNLTANEKIVSLLHLSSVSDLPKNVNVEL